MVGKYLTKLGDTPPNLYCISCCISFDSLYLSLSEDSVTISLKPAWLTAESRGHALYSAPGLTSLGLPDQPLSFKVSAFQVPHPEDGTKGSNYSNRFCFFKDSVPYVKVIGIATVGKYGVSALNVGRQDALCRECKNNNITDC